MGRAYKGNMPAQERTGRADRRGNEEKKTMSYR